MSEISASKPELWRQRLNRLRTHGRGSIMFASGVLTVLLALLLYNTIVPEPTQITMREVNDTVAQALASATPPPAFSQSVYKQILPSLVFIQAQTQGEDEEVEGGIGSGVVINDNGDILTSLHVIADASDIQVVFADGTQSSAEVVVEQPENDIAVLHADQLPEQFLPAILGNPDNMQIGDEAYVVGHPLGLFGSMSAGVISGFDRSFTPEDSDQRLEGLIQIDAAVNPGNSGGPLLNRNGQVIGIITALANPTQHDVFIGIGFAVPIQVAGSAAGLPPH